MGDALRTESLRVEWLGTLPYRDALALQDRAVAARRAGESPDRLLLLEHPPVVTLGRGSRSEHLLQSPAQLAARGIELHEVARGGDVTYHGPGQLVGYPILDLAARGALDVHRYLRELEEALRDALGRLGVPAGTREGYTGVFVRPRPGGPEDAPRKIASIGVAVRGSLTCHGFALNVDLDLRAFDVIVPCGLRGVRMTSVAAELGPSAPPDLCERARSAVSAAFRQRFA